LMAPKPKKAHGDYKGQAFYSVEAGEKKTLVTEKGGESDSLMGQFEMRKLWETVAKWIRTWDSELSGKEKAKI